MSTQTEITRLTNARNTIRDKAIELGIATSTSKLDALATAIDGITNRGAVDANVQEGETYTIPAGYHNGSGTVKGVSGGGNYSLQAKSVTPTKAQQSVTPDAGYYGLSGVTVSPIPEAYQNVSAVTAGAADVLSGKVIVDTTGASVAGTMPNIGKQTKTLDATDGNQSIAISKGYHAGTGSVNIVLESKSVTPTTSTQNITPTTGKVLNKVTVNAIPNKYGDASVATVTASDVKAGVVAIGKDATGEAVEIEGTMPVNSTASASIDGLTTTSYAVSAGYTAGFTVSLTDDIETALAAI